jgi:hypothetical protein
LILGPTIFAAASMSSHPTQVSFGIVFVSSLIILFHNQVVSVILDQKQIFVPD